ncbi:MAG: pro-sigmaK processing inhibitor BofA family protein [Candidatus Altiarchaeota archaeon]
MISIPSIALTGIGVALIATAALILYIMLKIVKKLFAKIIIIALNSLAGIIVLLALNLVFDADMPLNVFTVLVSGVFGLSGIGCLVLLKIGGII